MAKKIRLKSDFFFFSLFSLFWRILLLLFFFPNFLSYITEWQTKFSEKVADLVVEKKMDRKYEINAFSSSYTNEILRQFSEVDFVQLAIGGMLMVIIILTKISIFTKGQLISKCLFGIFNSPKKRTKNLSLLLWYIKLNCFRSFFGRIEDTKKYISKLTDL